MTATALWPHLTPRSRALKVSSTFGHFLYRYYDADGLLLYIGCSQDPKRRIASHAASRSKTSLLLQQYAVRVEVDEDRLPDRGVGHNYEAAAIRDEQPLFNYQHRGVPGWFIDHQIEDYEQGETPREWPELVNMQRRIASYCEGLR